MNFDLKKIGSPCSLVFFGLFLAKIFWGVVKNDLTFGISNFLSRLFKNTVPIRFQGGDKQEKTLLGFGFSYELLRLAKKFDNYIEKP